MLLLAVVVAGKYKCKILLPLTNVLNVLQDYKTVVLPLLSNSKL